MKFEVLTLFPEIIEPYLASAMMKRAVTAGAAEFHITNVRDHALDKHKVTDDSPFGGGPGMVMKAEPASRAIIAAKQRVGLSAQVVYLSPQGQPWTQRLAEEFAQKDALVLLCGRYEGIDERVIEKHVDVEISVGDYILTGGELGALILIDSITRLLPGVLGNTDSATYDSFSHDGLLDCPHYTRPETWEGMPVPEVLMSGHHKNIDAWRRKMQIIRTRERRPDLFEEFLPKLTKQDRKILEQLEAE